MTDYAEFLAAKQRQAERVGVDVAAADLHPTLHPWQAEIVRAAAGIGRAAIWADTGLGKTFMQVEWARVSGSTALIVAPLALMTAPTEPDWTARVRLAQSILNQRDPDEEAADIAVMALRGATVADLVKYTTTTEPEAP